MFTFQVSFWVALVAFGGGYAAAVFTWDKIKGIF